MGAHLILSGYLAVRGARVKGAHGGDLQVTTVDSSGQIHFLAPFNVFVPLTRCLSFGVHSILHTLHSYIPSKADSQPDISLALPVFLVAHRLHLPSLTWPLKKTLVPVTKKRWRVERPKT